MTFVPQLLIVTKFAIFLFPLFLLSRCNYVMLSFTLVPFFFIFSISLLSAKHAYLLDCLKCFPCISFAILLNYFCWRFLTIFPLLWTIELSILMYINYKHICVYLKCDLLGSLSLVDWTWQAVGVTQYIYIYFSLYNLSIWPSSYVNKFFLYPVERAQGVYRVRVRADAPRSTLNFKSVLGSIKIYFWCLVCIRFIQISLTVGKRCACCLEREISPIYHHSEAQHYAIPIVFWGKRYTYCCC
jgi:hypothetical protein